ncbi:MAG: hypothetical protein U0325_08720 [Polyangiales bacterium]
MARASAGEREYGCTARELEGASWVTYRAGGSPGQRAERGARVRDGALVQRMDYDAFGVVLDD